MTPTNEESQQETRFAGGPMSPIEHEVARGLRFMHILAQAIQRRENETVGLTEELNRLLVARGIASDTEWTELLENPTKISNDFLPL